MTSKGDIQKSRPKVTYKKDVTKYVQKRKWSPKKRKKKEEKNNNYLKKGMDHNEIFSVQRTNKKKLK